MDKTIEQILDECVVANAPIKPDYFCDLVYRIVGKDVALEAMKIFGKQCFHAGRKAQRRNVKYSISESLFNELFNKLEEKK